jgi:hypothetical protein
VNYLPVAEVRERAAACHASQGGKQNTGGSIISQIRRIFSSKDTFMRAYPAPTKHVEKDLFENVE